MPQTIDVPGQGLVEFPDEMNDDQISEAIRANFQPPTQAASSPLSGFAIDPLEIYQRPPETDFAPRVRTAPPDTPLPTGFAFGDIAARAASGLAEGGALAAQGLITLAETAFPRAMDTSNSPIPDFLRSVQERAREDYLVDPERDYQAGSKITGALTTTVPIIASGGLAPLTAAGMMGESFKQEAQEFGATPEQQSIAFMTGAGTGVLSEALLGLPALLRSAKASGAADDALQSMASRVIRQAVLNTGREVPQEVIEQFSQNFTAKSLAGYDPARELSEGLGEAAALASIAGPAVGATFQAAAIADARLATDHALDTINRTLQTRAEDIQTERVIVHPDTGVIETPAGNVVETPEGLRPETQTDLKAAEALGATGQPDASQIIQATTPDGDVREPEVTPQSPQEVPADVSSQGVQPTAPQITIASPSATDYPNKQKPEPRAEIPHVISSAINDDGIIYIGATPTEFHAVVAEQNQITEPDQDSPKRGFLVWDGKETKFVSRKEAAVIAREAKQLKDPNYKTLDSQSWNPLPEPAAPVQPPAPPVAAPLPKPPTSLKKAVVDVERQERGVEPINSPKQLSDTETIDNGRRIIESDQTAAPLLISRILEKGESGITKNEAGVLAAERRRLMNERSKWDEASGAESASPEERLLAEKQAETIEEQIDRLDTAQRAAGSTWSGVGRMYQRMIAEDFSLENIERRGRAAKQAPLTADERSKLKEQADRITELEKNIQEQQSAQTKKAEDQAVTEALAKTEKDIAKKSKRGKKDPFEAALDKAINSLRPDGRVFADPLLIQSVGKPVLRAALQIVRAAYKGGKAIADAIADGMAHLRANVNDLDEGLAKDFFDSIFGGATREQTVEAVTARAKANAVAGEPLDHKTVYEYVRALMVGGMRGEDAVMKAAHEGLSKVYPEATERDIRRAYVEYGKVAFPSKEEVATRMRELRQLVKIQEDIDRLNQGLPAMRAGMQRDKATQAIRDKIKARNELLKKTQISTPEALASRDEARQTAIRNRIADITRELETGVGPPKRTPAQPSAKTENLMMERDALQEKLREVQRESQPQKTPEQRYNEALKKRIASELAKAKARLAAGDFSPRTKKKPPEPTKENLDARAELQKVKNEIRQKEAEWKQEHRTTARKVWDGIQKTRGAFLNIRSSMDFSAPRQALVAILSNTTRALTRPGLLTRPIVRMFQAWGSDKLARRIDQRIKDRPNAKSGADKIAGIEYSDLETQKFNRFEENAHSIFDQWAELPFRAGSLAKTVVTAPAKALAKAVRMSNRAFITFLNETRAGLFDELLRANFKDTPPTPDQLKAIGNFVNIATGRGKLSPQTSRVASEVIWAPKLLASRLQFLAGQPLMQGDAKTRKIIAGEYARVIMSGYLLYLVSRLFDEKKETEPTSSDFGKIVRGDTRIDPWGGFQQVTVLGNRLARAETTTIKGDKRDIGAERRYGLPGPFMVAMNFLRSKARPDVAAAVDVIDRRDYLGQPTTAQGIAENLLIPLPMADITTIMREHGFTEGMIIEALSQFGAGVSHYEEREKARPTR